MTDRTKWPGPIMGYGIVVKHGVQRYQHRWIEQRGLTTVDDIIQHLSCIN